MAALEWPDFDRALRPVLALASLTEADLQPLAEGWEDTLYEDHRICLFRGEAKDGSKFAPTKSRGSAVRPRTRARSGDLYGAKFGEFGGFGPFAVGLHNNLSSAEYRKLDGPPLIPRKDNSRLLTNFFTDWGLVSGGMQVVSFVQDIVDARGRPFMTAAHFDGGCGVRRDARGISAWGISRADKQLAAFVERALS